METFEKIDSDTVVKTIEETIDLSPLKQELEEINKQLAILDKAPDVIEVPNDSKFIMIAEMQKRKDEINKLLSIK